MEKHPAKHKKIGLALGGGAAKGLAHIGVIKALENAGINIDFIAGTSMGALVGGYYAATKDITGLETIILDIKKRDIFSLRDIIKKRDGALFRGEPIAERLKKELGDMKIENCQIPFIAVTTNIKNGDEARLNSGNLVDAIRASIAIPLIFSPVEIDGKLLMDGGLVNPVPVSACRALGADVVIAVNGLVAVVVDGQAEYDHVGLAVVVLDPCANTRGLAECYVSSFAPRLWKALGGQQRTRLGPWTTMLVR